MQTHYTSNQVQGKSSYLLSELSTLTLNNYHEEVSHCLPQGSCSFILSWRLIISGPTDRSHLLFRVFPFAYVNGYSLCRWYQFPKAIVTEN